MQRGEDRPLELFYSYSHDDEEYRKKLGKHLSVLRRAGLITDWHDRDIDAGTAWQEEIDRHLLSADIVLLLVSASFIASDYCWGDDDQGVGAAQGWKGAGDPDHPASVRLAEDAVEGAAGLPRDNKAISLWANEHAAFDHVVTEIAKVVDDLRRRKSDEPELVEQASAVAAVASASSPQPPSAPHPPADAGPSLSHRERGGVRGRLPQGQEGRRFPPCPARLCSRPLPSRERVTERASPETGHFAYREAWMAGTSPAKTRVVVYWIARTISQSSLRTRKAGVAIQN